MAKVAILSTDGFEQSELTSPRDALQAAGHDVDIIAPDADQIKGWDAGNWGETYSVDVQLSDAEASDYDALVLPGGVINPDKLRINNDALRFITEIDERNRPIAAICHGPWTLINAEIVRDREMTSYESISQDLKNAGAEWRDAEVVVDGNLITSRFPDDLPAFNRAILDKLSG